MLLYYENNQTRCHRFNQLFLKSTGAQESLKILKPNSNKEVLIKVRINFSVLYNQRMELRNFEYYGALSIAEAIQNR